MTPGERVKVAHSGPRRYIGKLGVVTRVAGADVIVNVDGVGERWFAAGELDVAPVKLRRVG